MKNLFLVLILFVVGTNLTSREDTVNIVHENILPAFKVNYTPGGSMKDDQDCMARSIYFEARGEDVQGQFAVAHVILNRVKAAEYPATVCDVVKQRAQFSWYWDGKSDIPTEVEAWKEANKIAYYMLNLPMYDFTEGATHYHADYVNPGWSKSHMIKATHKIGRHQFYRAA